MTELHPGRVPDFLILGAQKSATTSLYAYLRTHPDVCGASIPEPHFFAWAWSLGEAWYRRLFPPEAQGRLAGEKSPLYLPHPTAPERAAHVVPTARLLVILRDPVERAVSNYFHAVQRGRERRSINEAFAIDEAHIGVDVAPSEYDDRDSDVNRHAYLRKGLYIDQLDRWLQCFDRAQILVLEHRQLSRDDSAGFAGVQEFLGLIPRQPPSWERNQGTYEPTIDSTLRRRLSSVFAPYNQRLFDMMGEEWDWT